MSSLRSLVSTQNFPCDRQNRTTSRFRLMPVAIVSVDEFLSLLEQSQLLRRPLMRKMREQVPSLGVDESDVSKSRSHS